MFAEHLSPTVISCLQYCETTGSLSLSLRQSINPPQELERRASLTHRVRPKSVKTLIYDLTDKPRVIMYNKSYLLLL